MKAFTFLALALCAAIVHKAYPTLAAADGNELSSPAAGPADRACASAIAKLCPHTHNATDACIECAWARRAALEGCGKAHVQRACGAGEDDLLRVGLRLAPEGTSCQSIVHCDDCYTHTVVWTHTCFWGVGKGCTGAGGIQCWTVGNGPASCADGCCVSDSSLSACLYSTEASCGTIPASC